MSIHPPRHVWGYEEWSTGVYDIITRFGIDITEFLRFENKGVKGVSTLKGTPLFSNRGNSVISMQYLVYYYAF